jgi:hypothetical protein
MQCSGGGDHLGAAQGYVSVADVSVISCIFSAGSTSTVWTQVPQHLWSQRFGDASDQLARGVAVNGSGNIVVTGAFTGTVDFGGGTLESAGYFDIFVAKFKSEVPTLLQSYFSAVTDAGIEISWHLADAGEDMKFHVFRAEATNAQFREIYDASIEQENLFFYYYRQPLRTRFDVPLPRRCVGQ